MVDSMKNNKGFSLVELIIVIAIMAVLIGVLAPVYLKRVEDAKVSYDVQNAGVIWSALGIWVAGNNNLPETNGAWSDIEFGTHCSIATAPKIKAYNSGCKWIYFYDGDTIKVGISKDGAGYELCPNRPQFNSQSNNNVKWAEE